MVLHEMDYHPTVYDTTKVRFDVMSASLPLQAQGWASWSQQQQEDQRMAKKALTVISGTYFKDQDLVVFQSAMQSLVYTMAHIQAMEAPSHFHGWFPSGYIPTFLRSLGITLTEEELNAALSLILM